MRSKQSRFSISRTCLRNRGAEHLGGIFKTEHLVDAHTYSLHCQSDMCSLSRMSNRFAIRSVPRLCGVRVRRSGGISATITSTRIDTVDRPKMAVASAQTQVSEQFHRRKIDFTSTVVTSSLPMLDKSFAMATDVHLRLIVASTRHRWHFATIASDVMRFPCKQHFCMQCLATSVLLYARCKQRT